MVMKLGMKHFISFEKCAGVSDKKWIRRSVKMFRFLIPGEIKLFNNDQLANEQLADAQAWIQA